MSSVVQLMLHNGKRVGIPPGSALLIFNMEKAPDPQAPQAKTLVRYTIDGQTARHALVRDSYKHCLSSFPLAIGGQPWAHLTDAKGNDQVIIHKSAAAYEEAEEDGVFNVVFAVPTGPIELAIQADIDEVEGLLRAAPPTPPAAPEAAAQPAPVKKPAAPAKKSAAKPPAKKPAARPAK